MGVGEAGGCESQGNLLSRRSSFLQLVEK